MLLPQQNQQQMQQTAAVDEGAMKIEPVSAPKSKHTSAAGKLEIVALEGVGVVAAGDAREGQQLYAEGKLKEEANDRALKRREALTTEFVARLKLQRGKM